MFDEATAALHQRDVSSRMSIAASEPAAMTAGEQSPFVEAFCCDKDKLTRLTTSFGADLPSADRIPSSDELGLGHPYY